MNNAAAAVAAEGASRAAPAGRRDGDGDGKG